MIDIDLAQLRLCFGDYNDYMNKINIKIVSPY